jgi:hypothetical protein
VHCSQGAEEKEKRRWEGRKESRKERGKEAIDPQGKRRDERMISEAKRRDGMEELQLIHRVLSDTLYDVSYGM